MTQPAPVSKQATIIFGLIVVGFMAFGLSISFYRNVLFDQSLENIKIQNNQLALEIQSAKRELQYFKSAQFKDKFMKENFGAIRPGEHVLILTNNDQTFFRSDVTSIDAEAEKQASYEQLLRQMPVYQHWQLYLFYPDRVRQLQDSL